MKQKKIRLMPFFVPELSEEMDGAMSEAMRKVDEMAGAAATMLGDAKDAWLIDVMERCVPGRRRLIETARRFPNLLRLTCKGFRIESLGDGLSEAVRVYWNGREVASASFRMSLNGGVSLLVRAEGGPPLGIGRYSLSKRERLL